MKCPRCQTSVTTAPDAQGVVTCTQCGARLRRGSVPGPRPTDSGAMDIDSLLAQAEPTPAFNPNATLPPGTPLKKIPRPGEPGAPDAPRDAPATAPLPIAPVSLEAVMQELQALRNGQQAILALLQGGAPTPGAYPAASLAGEPAAVASVPPPMRSRRRKTVLLIDDDAKTRAAAVTALEHAQVPVRTAADGQGGLAALAAERPDVIALELTLAGSMAGKDVINMIKATMEWVDIPIVLYTRAAVASQKEARIEHGADEFVVKGPGSPEALVAKVISVFRKG
jgi:CheY-like chemotaxis protein